MGEKPKEDYLSPETFKKIASIVISDIQNSFRNLRWKSSIGYYDAETSAEDLKVKIWAIPTVPYVNVKVTYQGKIIGGAPTSNILTKQTDNEIRKVARVFVGWIKKVLRQGGIV